MRKLLLLGLATLLLAGPASAMKMTVHNAKRGCSSLVTQVHPDLHGGARRAEIRSCKADPEGYNKATGL